MSDIGVRISEASGMIELYDKASGLPVEPDSPEGRPYSAMPYSQLTTLAQSAVLSAQVRQPPAFVAPSLRQSSGGLTPDELTICRAMGIEPAEFLATRAAQPHPWASPAFHFGAK